MAPGNIVDFETLRLRQEGAVLFANISAPPMNLLGTELVRDLVSLIQRAEGDDACQVLVFASADPDYFISHVDVTRIAESGAGGIQHLTRLLGRTRALEVMMSAGDYDADLAERYGWINRAMPTATLGEFVRSLAHRIAGFPAAGRTVLKDRVNAIALAQPDDFRRDSDLFLERARDPEMQRRAALAMSRGFQTHDGEMTLAEMVADLGDR